MLRRLVREPGFSTITVLTLALALAAVVTLFTLVNAVLLRQLPYPGSARLVEVSHAVPGLKIDKLDMSTRLYLHYLERSKTLAGIALWNSADFTLTGDQEPVRMPGAVVTPSTFRILGVKPELGRAFSEEEGRPGGTSVVILSHDLWQSRYGSDADILGRTLQVNGTPRQVVGVMPAGFGFPSPTTELWVPRMLDPSKARLGYFQDHAIARIRSQVTLEAAQTELVQLTRDLVGAFPDEEAAKPLQDGGFRPMLKTLLENAVGQVRPVLWTLLAAAGLILAIACANVANLFLVRFEERSGELAVRGALGASRGRLVGGLFAEGLALAVLAGGVAVVLAWGTLRLVVRFGAGTVPRLHEVGIDAVAVLFTFGAALLAAVLACLLPALRASRIDLADVGRDGGRASAGLERHRLRYALVAAQVALGIVLLVACGLVVRSLLALQKVDPGFRTSGATTFQLFLPAATYPDAQARVRFVEKTLDGLAALPGVRAVGLASYLPLSDDPSGSAFVVEELPLGPGEVPPFLMETNVSAGYFAALGIPLLEGRTFEPDDYRNRLGHIVISQSVARRYWPKGSALGKRMKSWSPKAEQKGWYTVVGVVGDVRLKGLDQEPVDLVYEPLLGLADGSKDLRSSLSFVVASSLPAASLTPSLRNIVHGADPNLPITQVRTVDSLVHDSWARMAFTVTVLLLASLMALVIAAVGLYGVVSYLVTRRTRELGIRMALGADGGRIRRLVLGHGLLVAGLGILAGVLLALASTRLLASLLFQVGSRDPLTFVLAALVLLLVAAAASYLPAARAARTAPAEALRST
ncbi:MAG TPA: ABC transporter permease [Thermoanaerobaculia bacterium]|nr:ABC transporter permease [Thermoanaerobaculia bacterium]